MSLASKCVCVLVVWFAATVPARAQMVELVVGLPALPDMGRSIGDIDNDAVPDLAVGLPRDDTFGTDVGRVLLYSGDDLLCLCELPGSSAGAEFGASITRSVDWNADGIEDFAVGAPGRDTVVILSAYDGTPLHEITGPVGSRFGEALDRIGDWDGDGVDDLIIGAPQAGGGDGAAYLSSGVDGSTIEVYLGDPGSELGSVVVGGVDLVPNTEPVPIVTGPAADYAMLLVALEEPPIVVTGDAPGDQFGRAATNVGDVDGDDVSDVLIGSDAGYARLLSGADGAELLDLVGATSGTGFGRRVAAVGDLDGDGVPDLAITESGADDAALDAGAIHVLSGADGALIETVSGPEADARLGDVFAAMGDVDGDGLGDLLMSSAVGPEVRVVSFTPWADERVGVSGASGAPALVGQGALAAGAEVTLVLQVARASRSVELVIGSALEHDALRDVDVPVSEVVLGGLATDAEGRLAYVYTLPTDLLPGDKLYFQMWIDDDTAEHGLALSNVISGTAR